MKENLLLLLLVFGVLQTCVHADVKDGHQSATVVSVANHETPSNYAGDSPSDTPLQAEVHSYDIGIQMNCTVYVVRYESALDYLPSVFAPNHAVEVTLQKHAMYVSLPGDRELRMSIGCRSRVKEASCQ